MNIFYEVARKMPEKRFMVAYRNQPNVKTLCGYTGAQMMQCFLSAGEIPDNIWFSEEWYNAMQVETLRATSLLAWKNTCYSQITKPHL